MKAIKEKKDLFDLDVKVNAREISNSEADPPPNTSLIWCTPGCAKNL
ncbi:gallidermin family lantibiotic [Staphylococcus saccharolyticus]|uniref:Lantibiotic epidermin n=1 Tax=Staphylococcus saccharolyticus TaxID=33028 RepID=A0A380H8U3_9STAP|nr:gallidermin family lantibiotic [Staphylococcus saccharolyticus]MBL7565592.1 gallidermin family lantibiotic [Staphylococcus saccharolyticus]MBL7572325.1 gallidermin family lantibiotic [Staphylococcus saccharolyticus]QQB97872.1 gallidermin family lantibiotic [Staphylococcus saccharolyticus]QRJ66271.1 gallidermin family lantibiotic [Staphylococcus saccharolyticus]RTX92434.1 gallidermin family protein [Staphylococcus saccharolyticus]